MLHAVFAFAVLCACLSALTGNRTAIALLASTAFTFCLTLAGVQFLPPVWMLVDLAVILVIVRPSMNRRDCVILALFAPGWALYFVDGEAAYAGSVLVSSAQMVLTFPILRLWRRIRVPRKRPRQDDAPLSFAGVW